MWNLLKIKWKAVLVVALFLSLAGFLWAYQEEVQQRAKAVAQLSRASEIVESSQETIERLKAERKAAEEALLQLSEYREKRNEQHHQDMRGLTNETTEEWRNSSVPDGFLERLRRNYGADDQDQAGDSEATAESS